MSSATSRHAATSSIFLPIIVGRRRPVGSNFTTGSLLTQVCHVLATRGTPSASTAPARHIAPCARRAFPRLEQRFRSKGSMCLKLSLACLPPKRHDTPALITGGHWERTAGMAPRSPASPRLLSRGAFRLHSLGVRTRNPRPPARRRRPLQESWRAPSPRRRRSSPRPVEPAQWKRPGSTALVPRE